MMPTPPVGSPFDTARDTLAQWIAQNDQLRELGLPLGAVYQADTAESPQERPFVVLRWLDQTESMGPSWAQPVTVWVYDDFGDYNRANAIAREIGRFCADEMIGVKTNAGWISQVFDLGVGADLADDGFDALVIPQNLRVIGRGL